MAGFVALGGGLQPTLPTRTSVTGKKLKGGERGNVRRSRNQKVAALCQVGADLLGIREDVVLSFTKSAALLLKQNDSPLVAFAQHTLNHASTDTLATVGPQAVHTSSQAVTKLYQLMVDNPSVFIPAVISSSHLALVFSSYLVLVGAINTVGYVWEAAGYEWVFGDIPKEPEPVSLYGVDVTGYELLHTPEAREAAAYAAKMHHGQMRKTGEPYITHCVHTARIVCVLVADDPSDSRALNTVLAAILHDVVDDTEATLADVETMFGPEVAAMVAGVTRLSQVNQVVRRHRRQRGVHGQAMPSKDAQVLRSLVLGMIDDPRVVIIKLADRLHNMRTLYALSPLKRLAMAQETLSLWCNLASCIGYSSVKAELEDLSFAVLHPEKFLWLQRSLYALWLGDVADESELSEAPEHPPVSGEPAAFAGALRQNAPSASGAIHRAAELSATAVASRSSTARASSLLVDPEECTEREDMTRARLNSVMNFDLDCIYDTDSCEYDPLINGPHGLEALMVLNKCERTLKERLALEGCLKGLDVTLSTRLKSLHSTYSKMRRKKLRTVGQVYDVRAMRIVVDDVDGTEADRAVAVCYALLGVVHSLWRPVSANDVFDDYIANAKRSGYQSLHTAIVGPDHAPIEIQIRTQTMHDIAEHGAAAHWNYKEITAAAPTSYRSGLNNSYPGSVPMNSIVDASDLLKSIKPSGASSKTPTPAEKESNISQTPKTPSMRDWGPAAVRSMPKVGQAALRVDRGGNLNDAVVLTVDPQQAGSPIIVAIRDLSRESLQRPAPQEAYTALMQSVIENGWSMPGHGNFDTSLEEYVLCGDGRYHKRDCYGMKLPTCLELLSSSSLPVASTSESEQDRPEITRLPASHVRTRESSSEESFSGRELPTLPPLGEREVEPMPLQMQGSFSESEDSIRNGSISGRAGRVKPMSMNLVNVDIAKARGMYTRARERRGGKKAMTSAEMNDKVRLFRSMLLWEAEISHAEGLVAAAVGNEDMAISSEEPSEVTVITWPDGSIHRLPRGSTCRDLKRRRGDGNIEGKAYEWGTSASTLEGKLRKVNVNNELVDPDTPLCDGDLVILPRASSEPSSPVPARQAR